MVELYDGLEARQPEPLAVARPSICCAVNQLFAPLLVAGFYYKTFMWPASFWEKLYEPLIRRAAGLGRAQRRARPRPLREGARVLRRAGDRRRPGRAGGGTRGRPQPAPRVILCRGGFPSRRTAAVGTCMRSTAWPAAHMGRRDGRRTERHAECAHAAPDRGVSASTTAGLRRAGAGHRSLAAPPPGHSRGSGCGRSWPSASLLASRRDRAAAWCSAATIGPA